MSSSNPDLPPGHDEQPKLSPLAQTFELIGHSAFKLVRPNEPQVELNYGMWSAAANLSMYEFRVCRRLKAAWGKGEKWG